MSRIMHKYAIVVVTMSELIRAQLQLTRNLLAFSSKNNRLFNNYTKWHSHPGILVSSLMSVIHGIKVILL